MSPLSLGSVVNNRYYVKKVLGEGAMSTVYLVVDNESLRTMWALKEMKEDALSDREREEALALFHQEAELLRTLSHEGLPSVKDFFSEERCHYIVMEFVPGETLQAAFDRRKAPCAVDELIPLIGQILDILDYLHHQDPPVIFRDLKPSNIMITPQGKVKLIDFGIARNFKPGKDRDTHIMGTPGFSAPEQYGKGQTDPRSDIYSLGATIYYLLTMEDVTKFSFNFPSATEFNDRIPFWMANLILKCLQKDPGARFHSAMDMKVYIEKMKHTAPAPVAPSTLASPAPVPRFFMPYPAKPSYVVFACVLVFCAGWLGAATDFYILAWLMLAGILGAAAFSGYSLLVLLLALIFKNQHIIRKSGCIGIAGAVIITFFILCILPNFYRARHSGQLTACKSNLKNIGTAMEMYSTDNKGRYPPALSYLTPGYLRTIPTCASAGSDTYSESYTFRQNPDVYTIYCKGSHHSDIYHCSNYPQYDAIEGLYDTPR
ncbi:MAG: protein kinase [Candidatus Xenobiia bacterium LiM19]